MIDDIGATDASTAEEIIQLSVMPFVGLDRGACKHMRSMLCSARSLRRATRIRLSSRAPFRRIL